MRGLNRVIISGNVGGKIAFADTGSGTPVCSFYLVSDRHSSGGTVVTARVKINVYGENFVRLCRARLVKGVYVLVEGELMNRNGKLEELLEVRTKEILFLSRDEGESEENKNGH
jgi:single-stranded DNA-binding protein